MGNEIRWGGLLGLFAAAAAFACTRPPPPEALNPPSPPVHPEPPRLGSTVPDEVVRLPPPPPPAPAPAGSEPGVAPGKPVERLVIRPGEHVFLEASAQSSGPLRLYRVPADIPGKPIIEIQMETRAEMGFTVLQVQNPFDNFLVYQGELAPRTNDPPRPTSLCAVRPHLVTFESWPNPVATVSLHGFSVMDTNPGCR